MSYEGVATRSDIESSANHQRQSEQSRAIEQAQDEQPWKENLRIGWEIPTHLFNGKSGTSLCGQAKAREDLSATKVRKLTSPIQHALSRLRSREQIAQFTNGVCDNCLASYYSSHAHKKGTLVIDIYQDTILNTESDEKFGFCYNCGAAADPKECGGGYIGGEHYAYMCDECDDQFFEALRENFGSSESKLAGAVGGLGEALSPPKKDDPE